MADLTNDQILVIMRCVQGKIPYIQERFWPCKNQAGMAEHLDKNPLFEGEDVPTSPDRYNTWWYIGKVPGRE